MQEISSRRLILLNWLIGVVLLSNFAGAVSLQLIEVWIVNALPLLYLSLAAAIVISCGHIDISIGGIMSLIGMGIVFLTGSNEVTLLSVVSSHLLMLGAILIIYTIYLFAINRGVSSIIVTLSFLLLAKGTSILLQSCMQGAGELCRGTSNGYLGNGIIPKEYLLSFTGSLIFSALAIAGIIGLTSYWRYRTRWGLEHIAVGMDVNSAKFSRISIKKIYTYAFLCTGILVYLATIIRLHGQSNGGWAANTGWGEELLAIAIAVIGGTRISGGRFDPLAIALATLCIYVSRDVITNDLGVPSEVASMLFGLVLLAIIWLDTKLQNYRKQVS